MFTLISHLGLVISLFFVSYTGFSSIVAEETVQDPSPQSDEEAFLIRRIAEFWKDEDFRIVKRQIITFLDQYPQSEMKEYFLGMLGDIYLQESNYEKALSIYQQVQQHSVLEKIILNKLQCYYELDKFPEIIQEGHPFLSNESNNIQGRRDELYFLMGEALFRQALDEGSLEKQQELMREARNHYEKLREGQYAQLAEFALAKIAGTLGECEVAADAYITLAGKHPDMVEELLFQAAFLEANFNKHRAIETFQRVRELDGKYAKDASFNLTLLRFQNEEYKEILSSYETISPYIPEQHRPMFNFIVGKSLFIEGNYREASNSLQYYLNSTSSPSDQLKNALLIQMTCAYQMDDGELFNHNFDRLASLFPNDDEVPKALFMQAMMLKEQGVIDPAYEKLRLIETQYGGLEDREMFMFEYGLLAHHNKRWNKSYEILKSYTHQFPESSRVRTAWKLFLASSINLYREMNEIEGNSYDKNAHFADLQPLLKHTEHLNPEETKDYALFYSKIAYELTYYQDALYCLQALIFTQIIEEIPPVALADAHFIAGLCLAKLETDPSALCTHLKQAIALNPDLYDSPATHIQMYNANISLAESESSNQPPSTQRQQECIDHAAKHLQQAFARGGAPIIKDENRLWLANYYYQRAKQYYDTPHIRRGPIPHEVTHAIDHATAHYRELFCPCKCLIELNSDNLHLEHEILKLTTLLSYQDAHDQMLTVLQALLEQQSDSPELHWMSQQQALYDLATAYHALGQKERAFETYHFIHTQAPRPLSTSLANSAAFKASCLHFELLSDSLRNEYNEEVLTILNDLKELQIHKDVSSEPIHLEAALEYAKIRAQISNPEESDSRYLFLLNRIKEVFTSQEDPSNRDYLMNIDGDESKQELLNLYMKFIDAEGVRIQAKHLFQQGHFNKVEELREHAFALYNDIKNNLNTPRELYDRIMQSIQAIDNCM